MCKVEIYYKCEMCGVKYNDHELELQDNITIRNFVDRLAYVKSIRVHECGQKQVGISRFCGVKI